MAIEQQSRFKQQEFNGEHLNYVLNINKTHEKGEITDSKKTKQLNQLEKEFSHQKGVTAEWYKKQYITAIMVAGLQAGKSLAELVENDLINLELNRFSAHEINPNNFTLQLHTDQQLYGHRPTYRISVKSSGRAASLMEKNAVSDFISEINDHLKKHTL